MKKSITFSTLIILFFLVTLSSCTYYAALERETKREVKTKEELQQALCENENQLQIRKVRGYKGCSTGNTYDKDTHDWKILSRKGKSGLTSYLAFHPSGVYVNEAQNRLSQLSPARKTSNPLRYIPSHVTDELLSEEEQVQAMYEWQQDIRYSSSSRTVEQFLQRFPAGSHVSVAKRKLEELSKHERDLVDTSQPITRIYSPAIRSSTPVVRTYSPVIRSSSPVVRTYSPAHNIPQFPWPPPTPSSFYKIPRSFLSSGKLTSLGDLSEKLEIAFDEAGYSAKSYYEVPGGFVLVARLERFNLDGTSKENNRWPDWENDTTLSIKNFSLGDYIKALFFAEPGQYRVIAFVLTSRSFAPNGPEIDSDKAEALVKEGTLQLEDNIAKQPYTSKHYLTALIYEFEKPAKDKKPLFKNSSRLSGKDHLKKSKLWAALEQ